jgi:hypothetical protein
MSGRGFFCAYSIGIMSYYGFRRGSMPYMRDVMKHMILGIGGTFLFARGAEKIAAEMYYNKILIQLADKYNFTPEEVMDL